MSGQLITQFNNLITQYKETYQAYLNELSQNNENNTINLTNIPNSLYNSESTINTLTDTSLENCQTSCSSNQSCSGATFNENNNSCVLGSGSGTIVNAQNSTAIVSQLLSYSYQLQNLNNQLLELNQQIIDINQNKTEQYEYNQQKVEQKKKIMYNNYDSLKDDKQKINEMIQQYEQINNVYDNSQIIVTSSYYKYILLLFIVILLGFLLFKFSLREKNNSDTFSGDFYGGASSSNSFWYKKILFAIFAIFICFQILKYLK